MNTANTPPPAPEQTFAIVKLDPPDSAPFPVIGIGASAGGLRAVQQFFAHTPANSGMAYVVIVHLSPEHESNLASLIQPYAVLPVTQVTEATLVEPNHIYIIPPAQQLSMNDGSIHLSPFDGPRGKRAPIDLFFRTLAETHESRAAAVVLSGTGTDGTSGLARVKECGGVTLVQEPREAEFDGMPRSALTTGLVDYVLPVTDMPSTLADYWRNAAELRLPAPDEPPSRVPPDDDTDVLNDIITLLRTRTNHDFSQYKRATVLRRIGRRMQVNSVVTLAAYLGVLRARAEEVQALLRDMLISVTNFFRDGDAWQVLAGVLPQLFAGKTAADQLRVWVAGCATGEEAYSLAIVLLEYARLHASPPQIQIFATDIDDHAIAHARQGLYLLTIAADVSPERLAQFFTLEQQHYRIKEDVRERVLFATHNLLRDPPFSRLDLVTCRNVLIYLNRTVQEQVLELFHFTLRADGYLLLGTSETTDSVAQLFSAVDKVQRLYQRRAGPPPRTTTLPTLPLIGLPRAGARLERLGATDGVRSLSDLSIELLAQYGPPTAIVDEQYDILHLARGAGRFLARPDGEVSSNLLREIHPGLRLDLRSALLHAAQQHTRAEISRVRMDVDGTPRLVMIAVQPIGEPAWARGYLLVIFNDLADAVPQDTVNVAEPLVRQLEEELQRTRAQLRETVEQYETAVEEAKAANEELQAINEELRAATEELETSKEELQSVNEELITVNQELKHKIEEISQTNNDLQNLIASTPIGTLFVDRSLHIKRYTPMAETIFNLIPSDLNRPLAHVTHTLAYDEMTADTKRVLQTLVPLDREVSSSDGRSFLVRLQPYRTNTDYIEGVVLTFVDISARKVAETHLRASEEYLRLLIESAKDYAIFTMDGERRVNLWNTGAQAVFGYAEQEIIGQPGDILFMPEDRAHGDAQREAETARTQGRAANERWHIRKDGSRFYGSGAVTPLRDGSGAQIGFVKIMRDLTEQKRAEQAIRQANEELEAKVAARTAELTQLHAARQELLRQLVSAQEEERRRISRELHDQMGQSLSALRVGLATLVGAAVPSAERVAGLQALAAQIDNDVDRLALELRPRVLDDLGLLPTLQQYVAEWSQQHAIVADFEAVDPDDTALSNEVAGALYRITQEALTNVLKHAEATRVSVVLELRADSVALIIEDNGRGFDTDAIPTLGTNNRRLGLVGMQERVTLLDGTFTIESTLGSGTTLYVRVPLAPKRGSKQ